MTRLSDQLVQRLEREGRLVIPNEPSGITRAERVLPKYRNRRCSEHTPRHASLKECQRAKDLQILERAGLIRNLREQVRIKLCDCESRPLVYVADFYYEERVRMEGADFWAERWEDAKGVQTDVFKLKMHLLQDQGVEVRIV